MLSLKRKKGEAIMIGREIRITIVDVRGERVVVSVEAPRDIPVHRKEVFDAINRKER